MIVKSLRTFVCSSSHDGLSYVEVAVAEQLAAVLVPHDGGPRLPLGHAEEHDLVPQHVLVVEVGGLGDLRPLQPELRGMYIHQSSVDIIDISR